MTFSCPIFHRLGGPRGRTRQVRRLEPRNPQFHFIDDHEMCRTRLNVAVEHTTTLGGKRKRSNSTAQLEWVDSLTVQESPDTTKSRRRQNVLLEHSPPPQLSTPSRDHPLMPLVVHCHTVLLEHSPPPLHSAASAPP